MAFHLPITVFLISLIARAAEGQAISLVKPGCQSTCGNITIPYPFGIETGCYLDGSFNSFQVTCNNSKLFLGTGETLQGMNNHRIVDISLNGEIKVFSSIAMTCFNGSATKTDEKPFYFLHSKFTVSRKRNRFTAVGCATVAMLDAELPTGMYGSGCVSTCYSYDVPINGSCTGFACCQTSVPADSSNYEVSFLSLTNSTVTGTHPCSYAFIAEENTYNFSTSDLKDLRGKDEMFAMVLDWSVETDTCEKAKINQMTYACKALISECIEPANNRSGYRCSCPSGYEGNPYLVDGCQDTNECLLATNPCAAEAKCTNNIGGFSCLCHRGYEGDGKKEGSGCTKKGSGKSRALAIALGVSMSVLGALLVGCLIFFLQAKRKLMKKREQFFQQNGGFMLTEQLSKQNRAVETARIFTAEDLKIATNNYHKSRIIGQGGFGTVYKGVLPNGKEVAIKKSKVSDQSQIEQFINEVIVLTQINHRNVVKLLGCCLETEVPMLVYEFISNGNLSEHLHNNDVSFPSLSWEMRLKIAAEAAGAIAYLHSAISTPIIHRDIKSANILLDENYTAKVADFGASKLVPLDQTQLTTLVQGTFGYLDPEYFHSSQLTEKSDVYSFGVLLAELLTGQQAISFARPEKDRNLATYFVSSSMKGDRGLLDIVEKRLLDDEKLDQIKAVAMLIVRCLRLKGEERPSMKDVAMELEQLKPTNVHPWVSKEDAPVDQKETEYLLKQNNVPLALEGFSFIGESGNSTDYSSTSKFNSMRDEMRNGKKSTV